MKKILNQAIVESNNKAKKTQKKLLYKGVFTGSIERESVEKKK